ncbi:MAG: DUF1343 domain-containing protein [Flavobacteriaceae bacterium]|nr:DUF1343 domain-containing protein [Flavobacteriaceae bacterium]
MRFTFFKNTFLIALPLTMLVCFSCGSQNNEEKKGNTVDKIVPKETINEEQNNDIIVGAAQFWKYKKRLEGKKVGVVANQTSEIVYLDSLGPKRAFGNPGPEYYFIENHLVDFLLSEGIQIEKIFSPEHGFRGTADAGAEVKDGKDTQTGLPIFSLHGKNKKPTPEQMEGLEVMVFDIQDVGVRFYTYLSTLHYVMEACAEANIPLIVLDRPNPNAHYVDGPMMEPANTGFLGLHPVPLVYGMTIGEYAQMINGEEWLKDKMRCDLTVIPVKNYTHQMKYSLPVRPSPNLPNDQAINLYPSLGLLEGTNLNAGRGTEMQFQILGSPYLPKDKYPFTYTPQPNFGSSNPKFNGVECHGIDLRNTPRLDKVDLRWIIDAYHNYTQKETFFNTKNFTAHAGTAKLQQQIEAGLLSKEISESWKPDLERFKIIREKYLLYK